MENDGMHLILHPLIPTYKNRIKLFFHCLFTFHRPVQMTEGIKLFGIYIPIKLILISCGDCYYERKS